MKINVLKDDLVTSTMDRTRTSCAAGSMLIKAITTAAVKQALGKDAEDVKIVASRTRVHDVREENRETVACQIKAEFSHESPSPLLVHWDGKLLPSISGIIFVFGASKLLLMHNRWHLF